MANEEVFVTVQNVVPTPITVSVTETVQTPVSISVGGAVPGEAGMLNGTTLAANVVTSSLTSVGTLTSLNVTGTITAGTFSGAHSGTLSGNASTATTLQTARSINGTTFNGSGDITTANWGTSRNITIGSTTKAVNGSGNVFWTTAEIGAEDRAPLGVPRFNLGNPTVREMALFDSQSNNKTEFLPITSIFVESSTNGTTWTTFSVTDQQKRRLVGGDFETSIVIPNGTPFFRIRLRLPSPQYVWVEQLYSYFSTNGHSWGVRVFRKHDSDSGWTQHTSSTATGNGWPGHLFLPFATPIQWRNDGNAVQGTHDHEIYILFTPVWNPIYPSNNINLTKIQLWGGYPAGRRNLYTTDDLQNATFPATVTATTFSGAHSGSGASLTNIPNSATTASSSNIGSAIVARDASGNFTTSTVTATTFTGALSGNATTATTLQTARLINGVSFNGSADVTIPMTGAAAAGSLTGTTLAANVVTSSLTSVGTLTSLTVAGTITATTFSGAHSGSGASLTNIPNSATTATSANTASAIVARDASGNFTAGTVTATLSGNASTATTLQTARTINGVSFNGSANITVAAAAGTLTGSALPNTVTASSLTSVGILTSLDVSGLGITFSGATVVGTANQMGLRWAAGFSSIMGTVDNSVYATLGTVSDRRLKRNILDIEDAIENIKQLRPITYHGVEFDGSDPDGPELLGFIADEVSEVYPSLVMGEATETTYQSVDYARMVVLCVKAIQQLLTKIEDLNDRVDLLV